MTDPRPLAERVRDIARVFGDEQKRAVKRGFVTLGARAENAAATLHEAADALALISEYRVAEIHLEARKDQP